MKLRIKCLLILSLMCIGQTIQAVEKQTAVTPQSALSQLPYKLHSCNPKELKQQFGDPVKIRAKRKFKISTGDSHKSENNIVAIYIGLPTPDAGHENIVIEDITSQKANPENIIFSPQNDCLLVEYFNVHKGFQDEITITFTLELYCRQTQFSQLEEQPYDKKSPFFKKYTKLSDEKQIPILEKHLKRIGCSPENSSLDNARRIYRYLGKQLRYGHYTSNETVPDDLLDGGKAHCGIYATLFVNLCRQAEIPARRCAGFYLTQNPQKTNETVVSAHNWAEFYIEGTGWIPVDPIMGDKADKRQRYYFGNMDNGHLCISKEGLHDELPIWYKTSASGDILYTENIEDFNSKFVPNSTIQGAHRVQYRWDQPIQITVANRYGAENLQILSREGTFKIPKQ